jgi:glycosyltransferase involved in cell wall biosynthesis
MAEQIAHLQGTGDFHNTVLSPTEGPLRRTLEAAGATVHVGSQIQLDDVAAYERGIVELQDWMSDRTDLVIGFTATSFPAVDVANRLGLPSILRIGEAEPLRNVVAWLCGSLDPEVERRAHRAVAGASAVLSNSHAAVDIFRADGFNGHFIVLGTGVDVTAAQTRRQATDREACRRELDIGPDERLLLCTAALWTVKGQAALVMAMDQVHQEHPYLSCALIGLADPSYVRAIRSFIARHQLTDAIRVLPFQDDLSPWWCAADVAVCPSESEALPAAVLQAMAHGLPVLGCRVGDLPRLIEPGVTGWLCDRSDLAALVASLRAVATAPPDEVRRLGEAAAEKIALSHDQAKLLDRLADLFRAVATGTVTNVG